MMRMNSGYGYGIAAALIWCGFILVSRMGGVSELLATDVIAIRYITCSLILLPLWWFKFHFNIMQWRLWLCGLIGGLAYALAAFHGFKMAPASHAAILLPGLMPLFIIVLTYWLMKERHGLQKWLGILIITLGIGFLFFGQLNQFNVDMSILMADGLLVLAALFWAIFSVLVKHWQISPWQVTVSLALITCCLYLPVYLAFLPKALSQAGWQDIFLQAFYQGVMATIVQMILYVKAVQRIGPAAMGSLMSIVPVVSGISALYIFNEPVNIELILGLLLVSLGAWFAHSKYCQNIAVLKRA